MFETEERDSLDRAARVRLIAVLAIAVWLGIEVPYPGFLYYHILMIGFVVFGYAPVWLQRAGLAAPWQRYLFPLLDSALLTFAVVVTNPWVAEWQDTPRGIIQFLHNDVYFFVFIGISVFSYSPRVVVWSGIAAALAWTVGMLYILALPDTTLAVRPANWSAMRTAQRVEVLTDPSRINFAEVAKQDIMFLVTAAILAAAVRRTRRLAHRHATAERDRANLARHFSPNMVDELARADRPLDAVRRENIAVIFVDIVDFTGASADEPPERIIGLLRDFHGRMANLVFRHGGTLDKFLGDGLMATFGTPRTAADDASRALACARGMAESVAEWNRERLRAGERPIEVGIGVHYGPVVLGNIGDEKRLEFAVVGDTVNVASRLESLTRDLGVSLIASEALIAEVRATSGALALLEDLRPDERPLRGRAGTMPVWTLARTQAHA